LVRFTTFAMNNSTTIRLQFERDTIDTHPDYQRNGEVWNLEKKQLLIDSILNDYDIPKLYFHFLREPRELADGRTVSYAIIDGRQRLEAIWGFMNDDFSLAEDFYYLKNPEVNAGGLKYSQLGNRYPELKIKFDSYVLPIICVDTDDIDLIEDMFSRLNEAVPLNAAEKRNAIGGPMARSIIEVAKHPFFNEKVRFSDKRFQHKEAAAKLLFIEESIDEKRFVDTKKVYLDEFVKRYIDDPKLNPRVLEDKVRLILNEMSNAFVDDDELLRSQTGVPIYYLLFKYALKQGRLSNISRNKLLQFKEKVAENRRIAEEDMGKANFDLLQFDRLSIQGTNDAGSIRERFRIMCKYFNIEYPLLQ